MSVLHVRHIKDELKKIFDGLIDLSDTPANAPEKERDAFFLTRALAAYIAQQVSGCSAEEAADFVIDGRRDNGIDAIAVDDTEPHLWLIQTKWVRSGEGSVDLNTTLKLKEGLDLLLYADYGEFNERFQRLVPRIDRALRNTNLKITLVLAVLGDSKMEEMVKRPLFAAAAQLNGDGAGDEIMDLRIFGLHEIHRMLKVGAAAPPVDLRVLLDGCSWLQEPYLAYYGSVSAEQVARWYGQYGDRLFDQNIRKSLGLTKVNRSLVETLITRPDDFWYFNNGITVLCLRARKSPLYANMANKSREFVLEGPSVVNGAQTVAAISEAVRRNPQVASAARVWIRVISLEDCPVGFADQITQATNTQNRVEKRDLAALDAIQVRLRDEFSWALSKTYVIKGGESDPDSSVGCTNIEAARALACAHRRPEMTVRAKMGGDLLWERGPESTYDQLFSRKLSAHRVWRTVLLFREIGSILGEETAPHEGRSAAIAVQGRFLIVHLVLHSLDQRGIDEPESDWEHRVLPAARERVVEVLAWLIHHVDSEFGTGSYPVSIFKNPERCRVLAERVRASLEGEVRTPEIPMQAREVRSSRAVGVLVDAGVIAEGSILEFRPSTKEEQVGMTAWLSEDPRRGRATWINSKSKPLLWEADGQQYAPTRLVAHMREQALNKTGAVQGTKYWYLRGGGSLVELASQVRRSDLA